MTSQPNDSRTEAALREAPPTRKIVPEYGKTYLKRVTVGFQKDKSGKPALDEEGNKIPETVQEAFAIDRRHRKEIESDFRALMGRRPTKKELKALLKQRRATHGKLLHLMAKRDAEAAAKAPDGEAAA